MKHRLLNQLEKLGTDKRVTEDHCPTVNHWERIPQKWKKRQGKRSRLDYDELRYVSLTGFRSQGVVFVTCVKFWIGIRNFMTQPGKRDCPVSFWGKCWLTNSISSSARCSRLSNGTLTLSGRRQMVVSRWGRTSISKYGRVIDSMSNVLVDDSNWIASRNSVAVTRSSVFNTCNPTSCAVKHISLYIVHCT